MNSDDHHYGDAPEEEPSAPDDIVPKALLLVVGLALLWGVFLLGQAAALRPARPLPVALPAGNGAPASIVVYVAGRVHRPGVYTLPPDARIYEVIRKAGGALPDADLSALNLAAWAQDGEKISVPARHRVAQREAAPEEIARQTQTLPSSTLPAPPKVAAAPAYYPDSGFALSPSLLQTPRPRKARRNSSAPSDGVPRAKTRRGEPSQNAAPEYLQAHPVNLNTATAEQLQLLPGIGSATARKILDYRAAHGPFRAPDDLTRIRGIGAKTLERLRPLITTGVLPLTPTPGSE